MNMEQLSNMVDYGIIGILSIMSFLVVFFWIERLLFYRKIDIKNYNSQEALELDITQNISIISSFGANAPYIGLLGTVLGIIVTFYTLGQSGNMDVKTIMTSLALALKATAMGLVVAIPAIFFYNHITRKAEVIITKWQILQKEKNANQKV
ncbi:MAG: TonB-system energizer ExbB [Sulfurovaceae bacterium]|nr:TonB-system energizer ExbB [Sulfurovaceae bacterium]MDD5548825.1 TonB-system energizer ExbB [Sulfurovaceae bacterium]